MIKISNIKSIVSWNETTNSLTIDKNKFIYIKDNKIVAISNNNQSFDFACLNFANPDMVGHTGDFEATVKACEKVDIELKKIVLKALKNNYQILVTADHGNAEVMINED